MELIISIVASLISISCAIYCGIQVKIIKNSNKANGDRNAQLIGSTYNTINTGDTTNSQRRDSNNG